MTTYQQQPTAGTGQRLLGLGIAGLGAAGQAGMSLPGMFGFNKGGIVGAK